MSRLNIDRLFYANLFLEKCKKIVAFFVEAAAAKSVLKQFYELQKKTYLEGLELQKAMILQVQIFQMILFVQ